MSNLQSVTRRDFLRTTGLGIAGLALAACAAPVAPAGGDSAGDSAEAPAQEPVNVTLISWWNHPFRDLLPAFNDLHPDIQVEFIDSGTGYAEKVMTAMVSGSELTDIVGSQDYNLPLWAATGGLADISDYMEPHEDRIVPYKLIHGVHEGKNYGVPWDGSPCLLYYRRDITEQYGIDATAISSIDDWLAAGEELSAASGGENRLMGVRKNDYYPWLSWTWQQGGGVYDLELRNVIADQTEAVQSLDFLKKLWDSPGAFQNFTWDTMNASLKDGSSAIFPGAIWLAGIIEGNAPETVGQFGVTQLPNWMEGGSRAHTWGGSQLCLLNSSKNKQEAFTFLEYSQLSQPGQEVLWTSGALFPVLHEAVDWPIMNEPVEFYGGQVALRMYAEVNSAVVPFAWGEGWSEAWDILGQSQGRVLDGEVSAEEALVEAAQEIRDLQDMG
ncbi:MAG: extracellular solute-binding protein [Caldilineaceae bacterium]|nr:extracellular solute-binding protein [Caldilineaceae bacterium]MCY4091377.1 extracellular solute-binding protein [Caldilineaceae bacterium]MDE0198055.1 extracellular solute-binding protein [Caldilineaceae bacterium]